jgi:histidinol-phosphate aminotransferase
MVLAMTESPPACPEPYIPDIGKTVVQNVAVGRVNRVVNLSLNESAYGASPLAVAATKKRAEKLERYPDSASTELRRALGRHHDLDPERILCGNGSEELLDVIGRAYARPGDEILFTEYGFLQFHIVAMRVGATPVTAPERDHTADVDALLAALSERTKVLYLANPNNPTGTWISAAELERLREGVPASVVLVIDSAYAEYCADPAYSDGKELVEGTDNVIVTHTFSKAYGLAAARVGWAYGPKSMVGVLNRMRGIGNVNALAQAAAVAALDDHDFVERVRAETAAARERMRADVRALGLGVLTGEANFVMIEFADEEGRRAADALKYLAKRGIVTRSNEDYGLDSFLRVTLGSSDENKLLLEGLADFLA